jgi:hypothetical protein
MTVSLILQRTGPDGTVTLGNITTNSTAYLPSNFVIVDYPLTVGTYEYRLVAASPDTFGDKILFNNMNMAGLYIRR